MSDLDDYLRFAQRIAEEAGDLALARFRAGLAVTTKPDGTPVTDADRASERHLRERIGARYPDHAILGEEEGGAAAGEARVRWILDPIDGTVSFARGVPLFAVLVAVEIEGSLDVGVAHYPALRETLAAARGGGCRRNGAAVGVSPVRDLSEALLSVTSPKTLVSNEPLARLAGAVRRTRGFCDAYGHGLVATGRIEAMAEPAVSLWDYAPFVPILAEAGGRITDFEGRPPRHGGSVLTTNGHLHDDALRLLAGP